MTDRVETIEQIEEFDKYDVDEMIASASQPILVPPKEFLDDPEGWIVKNKARLRLDLPLYCAVNIKIETKLGRKIPFIFNRLQRRLWDLVLTQLRARKPVRLFLLKSRQMGCTTWVLALFTWLSATRENRNSLLLNYDNKSAKVLGGRIQNFISTFHPQLKPSIKEMNREMIHFDVKADQVKKGNVEPGLNSRIDSQTADAPTLGRSYTYHHVLLSEFAFWPILGLDIKERLAALSQALPRLPGTIAIIETTAKGQNDAYAFWKDSNNGYTKVFISWLADETYRKNLTDEEVAEFVLEDSEESRYGDERIEARKIREQLRFWYPEYAGDEEWLDREIVCRLAWRRETINETCLGDVKTFKSEYPTVADDAWSTTGAAVFEAKDLESARDGGAKVARYKYSPDDPEDDDPRRKFYQDKYGPLRVYRDPEEGKLYVIGGDAGQGVKDRDESALVVLECPSMEEVASYNEVVEPNEFAAVAYWLGRLFNNALLGIENNCKGGFATLQLLQSVHSYPNLFYRYDNGNTKQPQMGFHTNDQTKSVMVVDATGLLKSREVVVRSEEILEQLSAFGVLKNGKMGARVGHDDLAMAWMIAIQLASHVHESVMRYERPAKGTFDWYASQLEPSSGWGGSRKGSRGRRGRRKSAKAWSALNR